MRQRTAVDAIKEMGATKTLGGVAELRRSTPELHCPPIPTKNCAIPITNIDGGRQKIEKALRQRHHVLIKNPFRNERRPQMVCQATHGALPKARRLPP
jgi:hypothetical protein